LAAASVYSYRVIEAASGSKGTEQVSATVAAASSTDNTNEQLIGAPAEGNTDVKLLEDTTDPFASGASTTQPSGTDSAAAATQPAADGAVAATQPSEGRSVSSSEVSVSDAGTVEIHVNDANLVEVLRMLSLQSQKNIIASKDVHGTVTANLYDVTVREALDAILHANGYAYREKGNFIYVYTAKEIAEIEKAERQMKTEVFRVFYTPAADAAIMIKPVLSKAGGEVAVSAPRRSASPARPNGGGGDASANNDVLVVTDYPENLDAVRRLLADIDRRPQQILLEATILRATSTRTTRWVSTSTSSAASTSHVHASQRADHQRAHLPPIHRRRRPRPQRRHRQLLQQPDQRRPEGRLRHQQRLDVPRRARTGDRHHHPGQPEGPGAEQAAGRSLRR
jgi:hypothetical protein